MTKYVNVGLEKIEYRHQTSERPSSKGGDACLLILVAEG